jgi:hypothetical protein
MVGAFGRRVIGGLIVLTAIGLGACWTDHDVGCTSILVFAVTGNVTDQTGAKVTPDRVVESINGGPEQACQSELFNDIAYECNEGGAGIYQVTVTVRGVSKTQSATLDADQCHVKNPAKLDFTFDVAQADASTE